jgi:arginase
MRSIDIIQVASELGAGTRGASLGIDAIRTAARSRRHFFFGEYPLVVVPTENQSLDHPPMNPHGKYIEQIHVVGERSCNTISACLRENRFPLILSGDHSMAFASIAGVKKAFPDKKVGVIWIDAHADLHSPYTSPSGNMHGMPLAAAAGEDNLPNRINDPLPETVKKWEDLKNIGFPGPKYDYENLVFFGVRSAEKPERDLMNRKGILNISVTEYREIGFEAAIEKAKSRLKVCDVVYVSFDVDSMDPSLSVGTGTPVADGFSHEEAREINRAFASWNKTVAWEMVEVNPTLDTLNKMAYLALDVLEDVLDDLKRRD